MKAVAYYQSLPIDHPEALVDIELPEPVIGERDLLVQVRAIAVNPVDSKVRAGMPPEAGEARVLGWDVAGVVLAVGSAVSLFKEGDAVYYAGALQRAGGNSERHVVDERIVGRKPSSLSFAEAAALPLTAITAWELLFERLAIKPDDRGTLLVVGAAGGVGSMLVQLARQLTTLTVIGTASREQSQAWVRKLGAHQVVDHSQNLHSQLQQIGIAQVQHVASLNHTDQHLDQLIEVLAPQGQLALIDDPKALDILKLKPKSLSLHWEFMFTRAMFGTDDMQEQHHLLNTVAELVDAGQLQTTLGEHFGLINSTNLRRAHQLLESGQAVGKIVLEGF